MTLEKGSLVLVDYTGTVKDTGKMFDTTREEDAKKDSTHNPQAIYRPNLISIGDPSFPVLKGLDEALANMTAGDKQKVEISPEKGFGERDSKKVRMIPLRKLGEDAEKVTVGDPIEIDGKKGIIRFIGSGRVQVDYNHQLAGKVLVFDVDVKKSLDADDDKIQQILLAHIPLDDSKISFTKSGNTVDIPIPSEILRMDGIQGLKHIAQMDIFKFAPSIEKINFVETHTNPKKPADAPKPTQEKPAEQPAS